LQGTELRRREDVVGVGIIHEAPGDHPLEEFATAFKE
jgi:hypothetical protein